MANGMFGQIKNLTADEFTRLVETADNLEPGKSFVVARDYDQSVFVSDSIKSYDNENDELINPVEFTPYSIDKAVEFNFDGAYHKTTLLQGSDGKIYTQFENDPHPFNLYNPVIIGTNQYPNAILIAAHDNPGYYRLTANMFNSIADNTEKGMSFLQNMNSIIGDYRNRYLNADN